MKTRTRNAIGLAAVLVVLAAGLAWVAKQRGVLDLKPHALDAVPSGALLVASADLDALRGSPLGSPFLREGREIPGLGKAFARTDVRRRWAPAAGPWISTSGGSQRARVPLPRWGRS